ncbi:hypothetical protein CGI74_05935 [Vibrio parahaemolyticus]|uniref:radical SAM/SPASM domain-containing protein n=1 Tax=Vibrio parahaemolyticus TaxID=670 RepID=UPI00111FAD54|nr:radical SAM/SPASM domain-containing protein [Vibrio parahaemolyticus]EJV0606201.1 SPASM domain-containing protein [Vibrio parahaemolyticus]ELB2065215.1 SPASM domain-containing protein [Vibrio parahaemolyticus]ELB2113995.1 SPASM domain-containing protein [Vibrio parahaemolyticus]MBM5172750.1 SPASM domain-containing protein [Vibrio parahaemolyticus]MBM5187766.1 SPASM domain-containing protein [Vibrio parahaemolyticus]
MDNRTAAFQLLPIVFNGLVVESTNRCNAKCSMCYQSSGPNGSDMVGLKRLDIVFIKKAMKEAKEIPALEPRFHLAGGESFLHFSECIDLFIYARELGYENITATSNCYWATRMSKARSYARRLKESGLSQLEISWDFWHLPYIEQRAIENAIVACREQGIYVNLRVLTSKSNSLSDALSLINDSALDLVSEISCGPVFNTGRATLEINEDEFLSGGGAGGNCHSVLNLTVNPMGNVSPCCAGADQTNNLSFGNIKLESMLDIYNKMNSSSFLRTLVFYGVGAFVPILERSEIKMGRDYQNICHLCWNIFSDDNKSLIVKSYFKKLDLDIQSRVISTISDISSGDIK